MRSFDQFEESLQDALAHLYDPAYHPANLLWEVLGYRSSQGVEAVQIALIREIESLKPALHVPPNARSRRIYGLLSLLYVHGLTQEDTAEQLNITARHVRRERPEAVHALAVRIWQRRVEAVALLEKERSEHEGTDRETPSRDGALTWRSQVRRELASLQDSAPGVMANVGQAIESTERLASKLIKGRAISLKPSHVQPDLIVKVHPSLLRQVFVTAVGRLVGHMVSGQITMTAEARENRIEISIAGQPVAQDHDLNTDLARAILTTYGGKVAIVTHGDRVAFKIELPSISQTVLVVDDNQDMAHLYRRYAAGTRYRIVHTGQGQRVFDLIEDVNPDVLVLDIMLPDVDGWELLTHLREHPQTQFMPIVVCSVVRERELALALGADQYLTKPVQRPQFIAALDQLLSRASA